ncbi:hypothetical protein SASPL_127810 [Salvia splendens]|uniref:Uncharacterized protein n=1 Tax=Salvia splendens TaxID=180675 RepID=A0A8X8ZM86_SALSN|nr:hypothetical protein SASPL_127810 [Salvia splendens]
MASTRAPDWRLSCDSTQCSRKKPSTRMQPHPSSSPLHLTEGEGQHDCVGRGVYCEEDEDWDEDEACEEGILPTGDQGEVEAEGGGAASEEEAESHHQKEGQYGRWPLGHLERLPNVVV